MEGVKIITIRRPQVMNALNDEMNDEILSVLKETDGEYFDQRICYNRIRNELFQQVQTSENFPKCLETLRPPMQRLVPKCNLYRLYAKTGCGRGKRSGFRWGVGIGNSVS